MNATTPVARARKTTASSHTHAGTTATTKKPRSAQSSLEASPTPAPLTRTHSHNIKGTGHPKTPRNGKCNKTPRQTIPRSALSPKPLSERGVAAQLKSPKAHPTRPASATATTRRDPLRRADTTLPTFGQSAKTPPKGFMTIFTKSPSPDHASPSRQSLSLSRSVDRSSDRRSSTAVRHGAVGAQPVSAHPSSRAEVSASPATRPTVTTTVFTRSATTMGGVDGGRPTPTTKGGIFLEQWRARQHHRNPSVADPKQPPTLITSTTTAARHRTSRSRAERPNDRLPTHATSQASGVVSPLSRVRTPEQAPLRRTSARNEGSDGCGDDDDDGDLADSAITSPSSTNLTTGVESSSATSPAVVPTAHGAVGVFVKPATRSSPSSLTRPQNARAAGRGTRGGELGKKGSSPLEGHYGRESPINRSLAEELLPDVTGSPHKNAERRSSPSPQPTTGPSATSNTAARRLATPRSTYVDDRARQATAVGTYSSPTPRVSQLRSQRQYSQSSVASSNAPYLEELDDFIEQQKRKLRHRTSHTDDEKDGSQQAPSPPGSTAAAALLAAAGLELSARPSHSDETSTVPTGVPSQHPTPPPLPLAVNPPARAVSSVTTRSFARQDSGTNPLRDVLARREQRLQRQASTLTANNGDDASTCANVKSSVTSLATSPRPSATAAVTAAKTVAPQTSGPAPFERQPSALELYRRRKSLQGQAPAPLRSTLAGRAASSSIKTAPENGTPPLPLKKPQLTEPQPRRASLASLGSSSSTFVSSAFTSANISLSLDKGATTLPKAAHSPATTPAAAHAVLFERHTALPVRTTTKAAVPVPTAVRDEKTASLLRAAAAVVSASKPPTLTAGPPMYTEVPGFADDDDSEGFGDGTFFSQSDEDADEAVAHHGHSTEDDEREMAAAYKSTQQTPGPTTPSTTGTPVPASVPKLNFSRLPSANPGAVEKSSVAATGAESHSFATSSVLGKPTNSSFVSTHGPPQSTTAAGQRTVSGTTSPAAAIDELEQSVNAMLQHYTKKPPTAPTPAATAPSAMKAVEPLPLTETSMPSILAAAGPTAAKAAGVATPSSLPPATDVPTVVTASDVTQYRSKELRDKVNALLGKPTAASSPALLVKVDAISLAALRKPQPGAATAGAAKMADINKRLASSPSAARHGEPTWHSDDDEEDAPLDPHVEWCDPDEKDRHRRLHFAATQVPDWVPALDFSKLFIENDKDAFDKYRVALPSAVADPIRNYAALLEQIGPLLPTPVDAPLPGDEEEVAHRQGSEAGSAAGDHASTSVCRASRSSVSLGTASPFLGRSTAGGGLEDVQFVPVVSHESSTERLLRSVQEMHSHDNVAGEDSEGEAEAAACVAGGKGGGGTKDAATRAPRVQRRLQLTDESDALDGGRGREREEKVREHKRSVDRLLFGYQEQRARKVVVAEEAAAFTAVQETFKAALRPL